MFSSFTFVNRIEKRKSKVRFHILDHLNMSLENQKLDSHQRQQIMATVQQQLAIQNAQELLQVSSMMVKSIYQC